ncbi:MAG: hypothetical protein [Caudoviricetes sp.]|nr:MAG: hypothetical protein [Caudoviricetes sp.]
MEIVSRINKQRFGIVTKMTTEQALNLIAVPSNARKYFFELGLEVDEKAPFLVRVK